MQKIYLGLFAIVLAIACVMFSVDRVRINQRYNALGSRIDEKTRAIQENLDAFEKERAASLREIRELQSRFQFVTEEKHPDRLQAASTEGADSGSPFAQIPRTDADRGVVQELIRQIPVNQPVVPADIQKVFRNYCDSPSKLPDMLYCDPESGRVIDRNAAILEDVCRYFGLPAATTLQWNMADLTRRTVTVIRPAETQAGPENMPTAKPAEPVTVFCGDSRFREKDMVAQSRNVTAVFPFQVTALGEKDAERELMMNLHQLPLGGRYVHLIRIQRAAGSKLESVLIEYDLPEVPEGVPAPRLQAVSLRAGAAVESSVSGGIQSFRAAFDGDICEFLIVCDTVTIPKRIMVAPFSGKQSFLPGK